MCTFVNSKPGHLKLRKYFPIKMARLFKQSPHYPTKHHNNNPKSYRRLLGYTRQNNWIQLNLINHYLYMIIMAETCHTSFNAQLKLCLSQNCANLGTTNIDCLWSNKIGLGPFGCLFIPLYLLYYRKGYVTIWFSILPLLF